MLTELHRIVLAAWAVAVPSPDPRAPSLAIRPDPSESAAALGRSGPCAGPAALVPDSSELRLCLVRFYRAEDGMTRVWAFLPVPPAEASLDQGYSIAVRVKDSTDRALFSESWTGPPGLHAPRARPLELLHFLAAPGAYHLEVNLMELGTGRRHHGAFDFRAYPDDPGASDLLIARLIRHDPALDGPIAAGEFRHGGSVVTPAAPLRVSPVRARVFFLLEVYLEGMQAQEGTMEARVTDSAGRVLVRTPPVAVAVAGGGAVLRGQVRVDGLAPGAYALRVQTRMGTRTLERAAPFLVDSLSPAPRKPEVVMRRFRYQDR